MTIHRLFATTALLAVIAALSGCENLVAYSKFAKDAQKLDTGVVDYRYYDVQKDKFTYHFAPRGCVQADDGTTVGAAGTTPPKTRPSGKKDAVKAADPCESVIPKDRVLRNGDSVSVNLLFGFICDFYESAQSPRELKRDFGTANKKPKMCREVPENRAGTRGEIAVMASVFELGGDRKIVFQPDSTPDQSARLVYFDGDVRESGQPLNLSNLPIYGPVSYSGRPMYVSFYIAELDAAEAQETGVILGKLAEFGAKAYPPASPVLSALTKVGTAYLESKQDDLIFDYKLSFDAIDGISPVVAALASGLYVFTREQERLVPFNWDKHCLDQTTGRLHKREDDGTCSRSLTTLYQDETYLTVQIKRNEPALDHDLYQTFHEFTGAKQDQASTPAALTASLKSLEGQVARTAAYDRARSQISKLASTVTAERRQAQEALMTALCLGVAADGTVSAEALSRDQMFYLVRRAELTENVKADVPALLNVRSGLCNTSKTNWAGVEAVLKVEGVEPKTPSTPEPELVERSPEAT